MSLLLYARCALVPAPFSPRAADFNWSISGGANARVLVDSETYRLFVFAGEGWQGEEIFALVGTRDDGTRLETVLRVAVTLPQAALSLTAQTEVGLFAGTNEIRLPTAELIQGETDPAQILWTAQGLQPINAVYDTSSAELVLTPGSPWLNSDIIEIKAILPGGAEVSGLVFAQVFPNDGSIGSESEDFTLALIPNVFQPEYIDIFLLNNLQSTRAPLLRLNDGSWSDLALEIRVTDRAGNRKTVLKNANGSGTPLAFALRQSTSIAPRLFSTCSKYAESPRSIQRTKT